MTFDPNKLLEALKLAISTGGWYKLAIAGTCGLYLLINSWDWIPPAEAWEIRAATFGLLLFGLLAAANFITSAHRFFPLDKWAIYYINLRRSKREVERYIPHMTTKEREIIAYLLAKNQKTFLAAIDGGHAATLLSRGIVTIIYQPGQQIEQENVTMNVPDHLWGVLQKHKNQFPYTAPDDDEPEAHPWRVHWMARI